MFSLYYLTFSKLRLTGHVACIEGEVISRFWLKKVNGVDGHEFTVKEAGPGEGWFLFVTQDSDK
jgi:hypothetical protein